MAPGTRKPALPAGDSANGAVLLALLALLEKPDAGRLVAAVEATHRPASVFGVGDFDRSGGPQRCVRYQRIAVAGDGTAGLVDGQVDRGERVRERL